MLPSVTSPMGERIRAINGFVVAGYEVHANFSTVLVHENWRSECVRLFRKIDDVLTPEARAQLKCEVIMLTHNERLHDVNMSWHPKAEQFL